MVHPVGTLLFKAINSPTKSSAVQILIVAALVDFVIALLGGEGAGAFVEPAVIILILVANGALMVGGVCTLGSGAGIQTGPAGHALRMVWE